MAEFGAQFENETALAEVVEVLGVDRSSFTSGHLHKFLVSLVVEADTDTEHLLTNESNESNESIESKMSNNYSLFNFLLL